MRFFEGDEILSSNRFPNFDIESYFRDKDIFFKKYNSDGHNELAINCPECELRGKARDTKQKLWLNTETGFFHCYRCKYSGSLPGLIQLIEKVPFEQALKVLRGDLLDPLDHLSLKLYNEPAERDDEPEQLREIELPYGYMAITGPHPYLKSRGIPWRYAARNDWGYAEVGFCKNRIIVPTFMEDRLVFWQARACWESEFDDFKKVLNPRGVSARSVLFNYDGAKKSDEIIVVEGFTDAVKAGENAVATNGKNLHPQQVEWLRKTKAKKIVLMWDRDAWEDGYTRKGKTTPCSVLRAASMLKMFFEVRLARLPAKRDPGSYPWGSKELKRIVAKAKPAE